jgi:hypothetical protein
MRRVFDFDVLTCPRCGGRLRVIEPAASPKAEPAKPSEPGQKAPSEKAIANPPKSQGEQKSPTGSPGHLTAQHFAIGDKITTKSGKSGVVTHIHGKAGYLFIKNAEQGKTYHVSWGSVTSIDGQNVADIPKQGKGDGLGEDLKAAADKMVESPAATTALKSHGWKPVKTDAAGRTTFAHPKMGGQFQVGADGKLTNLDSGTKLSPDEAARYLDGFHKAAAKQAEGAKKGISTDSVDYSKGDTVVTHDGTEWTVHSAVGPGVYAHEAGPMAPEGGEGASLLKWNEIAKHTPKKEGPGSCGSTKWYYDKSGHVQYGEPPEGTKAGVGEPGGHGLKVGDWVDAGGQPHTVAAVSDTGVILKDEEGYKTDVSPKDAAYYLSTGHWKKQSPEPQAKTPAKIVAKKKAKGWTTGTMESTNQAGETTATQKGSLHESGLFVHHNLGGGDKEWSDAEHKYVLANWKVSYYASGLSVGSQFKTKADAMAAAEKLAPIADWHKDKEATRRRSSRTTTRRASTTSSSRGSRDRRDGRASASGLSDQTTLPVLVPEGHATFRVGDVSGHVRGVLAVHLRYGRP